MKILVLFFFNFYFLCQLKAQTNKTIYCFPGQGSDGRIFDSLVFDSSYKLKIIEYGIPEKEMTLCSFAKQLSKQIDTAETFILISLG
jgi:hypothetical protein